MPEQYDLSANWHKVKQVAERGQRSTIYCSIASLNADQFPNVTPIGTVFFRDDCTGYFFDHYTTALGENLDRDPRFCLSSVDAGKWFWFRSFIKGNFVAPPGVRLYGTAGALREASAEEIAGIENRVKPFTIFKGARMLWTNFTHVRDLTFTRYRPITYPVMMENTW